MNSVTLPSLTSQTHFTAHGGRIRKGGGGGGGQRKMRWAGSSGSSGFRATNHHPWYTAILPAYVSSVNADMSVHVAIDPRMDLRNFSK